jgi:hypothetical protein
VYLQTFSATDPVREIGGGGVAEAGGGGEIAERGGGVWFAEGFDCGYGDAGRDYGGVRSCDVGRADWGEVGLGRGTGEDGEEGGHCGRGEEEELENLHGYSVLWWLEMRMMVSRLLSSAGVEDEDLKSTDLSILTAAPMKVLLSLQGKLNINWKDQRIPRFIYSTAWAISKVNGCRLAVNLKSRTGLGLWEHRNEMDMRKN